VGAAPDRPAAGQREGVPAKRRGRIEAEMPEATEWRSARLRSARDLTTDIRLFEIEPEGPFVPPSPGSHIDVMVQASGRPDVRSYSIVGLCTDGLYRIAVKLTPDSRGGAIYLRSLAPGARLRITTPRNDFVLGLGRPDYLLIAGGVVPGAVRRAISPALRRPPPPRPGARR
jgi:NAD(P)H-flavin reductase